MKELTIVLLLVSDFCYSQRIFVGESQPRKEEIELLTTERINRQNVSIKENEYEIFFDKEEVLKSLKGDLKSLDKAHQELFVRVIKYLQTVDSLIISNPWTDWKKNDTTSIWDNDLKDQHLTTRLLRETLCQQIEGGRFELWTGGKEAERFYFKRVDSIYGGNVKGVFTDNNMLFWICPPFVVD